MSPRLLRWKQLNRVFGIRMNQFVTEMKNNPIGGYFSLELNEGVERHGEAIKLNAGRYALEYILKARKYSKVYLPYYICASVLQPFKRLNVAYVFYHINELLEPSVELHPSEDEAVLYVNYFGLKNQVSDNFCFNYHNTILDHTQAFYSGKGNKFDDKSVQCDTFYSCRKYFGVPDGAYLYTDRRLDDEMPQDESYERMTFLVKRIDRSPQEAYEDFHKNNEVLSSIGMRGMSRLTETMMRGIDYNTTANRRLRNFQALDKVLRDTNFFKWEMDDSTVPMVYPYYAEKGEQIRRHLIDNQVFCARYWPNVLEWCKPNDWEYQLAKNLVCLPIDQRYGDEEMERIIDLTRCSS